MQSPMLQGNACIVMAHPDDMELNCGAYVSHLAKQSYGVSSVIVAADRRGSPMDRVSEARRASYTLGIAEPTILPYFIAEIDFSRLRSDLVRLLEKDGYDILITHYPVDSHYDHCLVAAAVSGLGHQKLFYCRSTSSYCFHGTHKHEATVEEKQRKWKALTEHRSQGFGSHTIEMVESVEQFAVEQFAEACIWEGSL